MPRKKLTKLTVDNLKAIDGKRTEFFDATLPGFGLRVSEKGVKTWFLYYRIHGKQHRYKLGTYPGLELAKARDLAGQKLNAIEKGIDPLAERRATRRRDNLLSTVVEDYLTIAKENYEGNRRKARPNLRPATLANTRRQFEIWVVDKLGGRPIASVTDDDIKAVLADYVASLKKSKRGTGAGSRRLLTILKAFFSWCQSEGLVKINPAQHVVELVEEGTRDRVLKDAELRALWNTCDSSEGLFPVWFKMLLLTGQRRSEVAQMRWKDIDLDDASWTIPAAANKSGRAHFVPLSDTALELLHDVPVIKDATYVFSTTGGETPISGFSRFKSRLDKHLCDALGDDVEPWSIHDVRRTVASRLVAMEGITPDIVGAVLGHAVSGVTETRYIRHSYAEERRAALDAWATKLLAVVAPREGNVVDMDVAKSSRA